jgi:hypothetical protein
LVNARLLAAFLAVPALLAGAACASSKPSSSSSPTFEATATETVAATTRPAASVTAPPAGPAAAITEVARGDGCAPELSFPEEALPSERWLVGSDEVQVVDVAFEVEPWRESTDEEYRQPYADGDAIAWIASPPGPFPTRELLLQTCGGEPRVVARRAYLDGHLDVPMLDDGVVVWLDWDPRGDGAWEVFAASSEDAKPVVVLDSNDWLAELGAVGRRPMIPEPQVDDGRFITWIRTSETDATDLVVGNLDGEVTQVTSRSPDGGIQVGPSVAISGNRGLFLQRELSVGRWTWDLWSIDLDTLELVRLTNAVADGVTYELPAISGEWAAFVEGTPGWTYVPTLLNLETGECIELSPPVSDSSSSISNIEVGRSWVVWSTADGTYLARLDNPRRVYFVEDLGPHHMELDGSNLTWWDSEKDAQTGELIGNYLFWVRLPDRTD